VAISHHVYLTKKQVLHLLIYIKINGKKGDINGPVDIQKFE